MKPVALLLLALAALGAAVVAVAVMPAFAAAPSEVKLEINVNCVEPAWPCWTSPGSPGPYPPSASEAPIKIAPGGEIKFVDHAAAAASVSWTGSAPTCSGVPTSATTNWEGSCKFEQPGTYKFESPTLWMGEGFNFRKYEVVVESGTTTTSSTTTTTTTSSTMSSPYPPEGGGQPGKKTAKSSPDSLSGTSLRLAGHQRGSHVRGSVKVAEAGSKLTIEALVAKAQLGMGAHGQVRVARLSKSSLAAGKTSFSLTLNGQALHALNRRGHLRLKVRIMLGGPSGKHVTRTVTVAMRKS